MSHIVLSETGFTLRTKISLVQSGFPHLDLFHHSIELLDLSFCGCTVSENFPNIILVLFNIRTKTCNTDLKLVQILFSSVSAFRPESNSAWSLV